MQLLEEKHSSGLRQTLLKLSSQTEMVSEEDTARDSISESENSSSGPIMIDSVITENWTDVNETDVDEALSAPLQSELIDRGVQVLERHIINVLVWRAKKTAAIEATETGTAHGARLQHTDAATTSPEGSRTDDISLNPTQRNELIHYVTTIASMYNDVLYHNFEHASHVLASADSLISMLKKNPKRKRGRGSVSDGSTVSSSIDDADDGAEEHRNHFYTFGISSCPMTHLALVFSALVHDVEHQGVGNKQLIEEKDPLAIKYDGKSVAENNSLDVALELLRTKEYSNLYQCILGPRDTRSTEVQKELEHDEKIFMNIMLNMIQSTDISSKDRLEGNKAKWRRAFEEVGEGTEMRLHCCNQNPLNRSYRRCSVPPASKPKTNGRARRLSLHVATQERKKETIPCPACAIYLDECLVHLDFLRASSVLEQMIQAADVAHSMQSWPIFMKWNTKLYDELWAAKLEGRGPDVSAGWFKGQIGFFDHYITPLATRLQQCGVFGELGGLFLENVNINRDRWIQEGEERCREMHERVLKQQGDGTRSKD